MTDNPNIRKSDLLPRKLCDKENIDNFLNKNKGKKVVVVQGLGFVGSVMSLVCANASRRALSCHYARVGASLAIGGADEGGRFCIPVDFGSATRQTELCRRCGASLLDFVSVS